MLQQNFCVNFYFIRAYYRLVSCRSYKLSSDLITVTVTFLINIRNQRHTSESLIYNDCHFTCSQSEVSCVFKCLHKISKKCLTFCNLNIPSLQRKFPSFWASMLHINLKRWKLLASLMALKWHVPDLVYPPEHHVKACIKHCVHGKLQMQWYDGFLLHFAT